MARRVSITVEVTEFRGGKTGADDIPGNDNTFLAEDAFNRVKNYLKQITNLSNEEKLLLDASTPIEDVQGLVSSLVAKYEAKSEGSKTRKWLQKASETICHYGTVLDVFVQHHPEYVSLVWGAFKLLFMGVVNHSETLRLLAKWTSQVAMRLPRIKALSTLFTTDHMRSAVESLYSCILEFLLTAHSWCNESKLQHFYHSFTRPHKLRYNDLLERIEQCTQNTIELAALGSQAEIRDMHTVQSEKLKEIIAALQTADVDRQRQMDALSLAISRLETSDRRQEQKLDVILSLLEASGVTINELLVKTETFHAIQTSAQLDTNRQLTAIQLTQALSTFSLSLPDPDKSLSHHLFLRNRRASGMGNSVSTTSFWLSPKLAKWTSSPDTSIAIIKGGFTSRSAIIDFGIDVVQMLSKSGIPALWAFPPTGGTKGRLDGVEVIKYLTYQTLRAVSGVGVTEKRMALRYEQFQTATSYDEWFGLFRQVLKELKDSTCNEAYLVVDLAAANCRAGDEGIGLLRGLADVASNDKSMVGLKVKLLLLVYETEWFGKLSMVGNKDLPVIPVKNIKAKRGQAKDMRQTVNSKMKRGTTSGWARWGRLG
ncbi:hypothetical protein QBC44DRAFT_297685 [Cladorrhinum sp. PSN332]|nr:hypothetical protein QBC44DRAFT_297685 [Cladorrhinum sp. PSN332]